MSTKLMDSPFDRSGWQANRSAKIVGLTLQPPEDRGPGGCVMIVVIIFLSLLTTPLLNGQAEAIHKLMEPKPNVAAASLSSYLERVRAENSNVQAVPGSIWTDSGRLTRMATDVRAM